MKRDAFTRVTHWLCCIYLLLLSSVFLLAIPKGYYGLVALKYRLFLILSCALTGSVALLDLARLFLKRLHPSKPDWFTVLCLSYVLFTGISALLSDYDGVWLGNGRKDGFVTILLYVSVCLTLRRHYRPRRAELIVFCAACCAFCLLGLAQLAGKNPFGIYAAGTDFYLARGGSGTFLATLGNCDTCATLLSVGMGVSFATVLRRKSVFGWLCLFPLFLCTYFAFSLGVEAAYVALIAVVLLPLWLLAGDSKGICALPAAYGVICLAMGCSLTLTFSRYGNQFSFSLPALLLFAMALLLGCASVWLCRRPPKVAEGRLRTSLLLLTLFLIVLALALLYFCKNLPSGFLSEAHNILHGRIKASYGSDRIGIWRAVWKKIQEKPFFGGGPDTLAARGCYFVRQQGYTYYLDAAHSEPLNIWVNQGVFALLAYLGLIVLTFRTAIKKRTAAALVAGCGVLAYVAQSCFSISMPMITPFLWALIAVVNSQNQPLAKRRSK